MNSPCKECENRRVGCHSTCKKYYYFVCGTIQMKKKREEDRDIREYRRDSFRRIQMKYIEAARRLKKNEKS